MPAARFSAARSTVGAGASGPSASVLVSIAAGGGGGAGASGESEYVHTCQDACHINTDIYIHTCI
jgi:hypothetical protein